MESLSLMLVPGVLFAGLGDEHSQGKGGSEVRVNSVSVSCRRRSARLGSPGSCVECSWVERVISGTIVYWIDGWLDVLLSRLQLCPMMRVD